MRAFIYQLSTFIFHLATRSHPTIEPCEALGGEAILAHLIENIDKSLIALAIDMREFDGHVLRLLQGVATEEIGRAVILAQECPLALLDHGSQLAKVTNHE